MTTNTTKTPATPGTTKSTVAAPKTTAKPAAPKPAAAKAPTPAKAAAEPKAPAVAKEPKAPVNPTRTIKGQDFTAVRIFETGDAAVVTRVSRALRAGDIKAAMRKSKRKGAIRLFILDRQLTSKREQIEKMIEAAMKEPVAETVAPAAEVQTAS